MEQQFLRFRYAFFMSYNILTVLQHHFLNLIIGPGVTMAELALSSTS